MRNQFRGCLIGTALGDAVGFMVEKQMPETCANYITDWYLTGKLSQRTRTHGSGESRITYSFGSYSDDTQLSRELMFSMTEHKGWNPEDYAQRIAVMFKDNKIVGAGKSTREAADRLNAGVVWSDAGAVAPAAGNGTAMRAAPIGLFYRNDHKTLIRVAKEQSIITHSDPRCQSGSVLIALAAALGVLPETEWINDSGVFLDTLMLIAGENDALDPDTYQGLLVLDDVRTKSFNEAVVAIAGLDKERDVQAWKWISPYVTTTVMWSLWCFLNHMDNYEAAMTAAVICGGDVDTTASIVGGLVGTRLGLEAIPTRYLPLINDNGKCRYDDLIRIADDFFDASL